MNNTAPSNRWLQVAPIGVSTRELRFQHSATGEVIGVFQLPGFDGRGSTQPAAFDGQPVIVHRIAAHAADCSRIPIGEWTGDRAADECDWSAVCRATSRRLHLDSPEGFDSNVLRPIRVAAYV